MNSSDQSYSQSQMTLGSENTLAFLHEVNKWLLLCILQFFNAAADFPNNFSEVQKRDVKYSRAHVALSIMVA